MRLIILGILFEIVAFILFINHTVISDTGSYSQAAIALAASTRADLELGVATEQFINELKSAGLKPVIIQKIKREPFSVKGILIGLGKDNIQIFEYPDSLTALGEGSKFAQKYTGSEATSKWKNVKHVYVKSNIVIFYMGRNTGILTALDKGISPLSLNNK